MKECRVTSDMTHNKKEWQEDSKGQPQIDGITLWKKWHQTEHFLNVFTKSALA